MPNDYLAELAERLKHLQETMGWSIEQAAEYLMIRVEIARKALEHAENTDR